MKSYYVSQAINKTLLDTFLWKFVCMSSNREYFFSFLTPLFYSDLNLKMGFLYFSCKYSSVFHISILLCFSVNVRLNSRFYKTSSHLNFINCVLNTLCQNIHQHFLSSNSLHMLLKVKWLQKFNKNSFSPIFELITPNRLEWSSIEVYNRN